MSRSFSVWILGLIIFGAGAMGGALHSIMPDSSGYENRSLDWIRNILLGAAAALLSWGLYGPFAKMGFDSTFTFDATALSQLFAAILVGTSGARWLSKEAQNADFKQIISGEASNKNYIGKLKQKYGNLT